MKMKEFFIVVVFSLFIFGCKNKVTEDSQKETPRNVETERDNKSGLGHFTIGISTIGD